MWPIVLRYVLGVGLLAMLVLAAPASALTVRPTKTVWHSFAGASCGSTDGALVTLPRGARSPRILRPQLGDVLASDDDEVTPVAQVTAASTGRLDTTLVAGFQATGSDDVCTNPVYYAEDGWATVDVDLVVRFVRNVAVYVRGFSGWARRRPGRLDVGAVTLTNLSWRTWNGRVARGAGLGSGGLPVALRLSRPRNCGRWHYLTVRYRYTRGAPAGVRRVRRVQLDTTC